MVEGLRQAYRGQPLKLDKPRMQAILQQHEEQASAAAEQAQIDKSLAAEKRFLANERARAGVHELPEGILYSELASGTGNSPKAGGKVRVRYVGKLPDGSVFDQNQQPQWFNLDSVIEGWQVALPHMKAGAKWRLVIPSAQAYGAEGAGDLIAPYTPWSLKSNCWRWPTDACPQACTAPSSLCALCSTSIRQSSSSKRSCNRLPSSPNFLEKRSGSLHSPFRNGR